VAKLRRRLHRIERLRGLRYHHKLIFSVLIVLGILMLVVLLAKDREQLEIVSAFGADDPRFAEYVAALAGAQTTTNNRFEILANGDAFFPPMLDAIRSARRRIDLETYIYSSGEIGDRFTDALEAAVRRGVTVNLIVDAFGSNHMPREAWTRLKNTGAHLGDFGTPTWYKLQQVNYRTHRKILVVDGRVAFTGGAGVGDHWIGNADAKDHWRDTMVRVEGPLVRLIEGAFDENMVRTLRPAEPIVEPPVATDPVGTAGHGGSAFVIRSSTGGSNDLKRTYMVAIAAARRTLDICSPYFLTDRSSRWAIDQAIERGVHIRILTEGDLTDSRVVKYASRAKYDWLLSQGVEVFEYRPTMMHAKAMVVDGAWSMVGSANFDNRSLEMNDEMNLAVADRGFAARLTHDFDRDLRSSNKLELATWRRRPWLEKGRELCWTYFGEVF
jgi:cardiolipin synthase